MYLSRAEEWLVFADQCFRILWADVPDFDGTISLNTPMGSECL